MKVAISRRHSASISMESSELLFPGTTAPTIHTNVGMCIAQVINRPRNQKERGGMGNYFVFDPSPRTILVSTPRCTILEHVWQNGAYSPRAIELSDFFNIHCKFKRGECGKMGQFDIFCV